MSLWGADRSLWGSASGATWSVLQTVVWSAVTPTDLITTATVSAGGVTWTRENQGKCSTFETDGLTGLRIVQTSNSGIVAGTCPGLYVDLDDIASRAGTSELYLMFRITHSSNSGRGGVAIRNGSDYLFGGTQWVTSQFEVDAVAAADEFTDYSSALGGTSDRVIGVRFWSGAVQVYNHGAWSGAWPTAPGGTAAAHLGEEASAGKASNLIPIDSSSTEIGLITLRSGTPNPDVTFIAHRILYRTAS